MHEHRCPECRQLRDCHDWHCAVVYSAMCDQCADALLAEHGISELQVLPGRTFVVVTLLAAVLIAAAFGVTVWNVVQ